MAATIAIRALLRDIGTTKDADGKIIRGAGITFNERELVCWDPTAWYPNTVQLRTLCGLLSIVIFELIKDRPERNTLKFIIGTGNGATIAGHVARSLTYHMGRQIDPLSVSMGREKIVTDPKDPKKTFKRRRRFEIEGRDRIREINEASVALVTDVAMRDDLLCHIAKAVETPYVERAGKPTRGIGGRVAAVGSFVCRDGDFAENIAGWMGRKKDDPALVAELESPNHSVDTSGADTVGAHEMELVSHMDNGHSGT